MECVKRRFLGRCRIFNQKKTSPVEKSFIYLSFGFGPHGCLGAPLAKEEARIALETMFRHMPGIQLDESREIEWYRNAVNRGPTTLPLIFDAPQLERRA